mgnify:CR=1 FL=1
MIHDDKRPVYTISIAAELVGVHPRTLRIYEESGFVCPHRRGQVRLYSQEDILRIKRICELLEERHLNLTGVRALFDMANRFHIEVEKMMDELMVEIE